MKKILGLFMLTAFFTCCEVGVKPSSAEVAKTGNAGGGHGIVYMEKTYEDGIQYNIYHLYQGVHVINHTKEKLEIELLQLQIDSLKN